MSTVLDPSLTVSTVRERLIQHHPHACGVACAAMLMRWPYEHAMGLFAQAGFDRQRGRHAPWSSQVRQLEAVLRAGGATVRRQRFKTWDTLITPVIAKVMVTRSGNWHWVVIDRVPGQGLTVLDPWPHAGTFAEHPDAGMRPLDMVHYRPKGTCLSLVTAT